MRIHSLKVAVAVAISFAPLTAYAASAPVKVPATGGSPLALCTEAQNQVEESLKDYAAAQAEGILDNSAARESVRQAKGEAQLLFIQANLEIMAQNHCPAFPRPILPRAYFHNAVDCELDRQKAPISSTTSPPTCNRANWTRQ